MNVALTKWRIGEVSVTRVVEIESVGEKEYILPQATPEALRRLAWLRPHFADQCGRIKMSVHSFLVETPTRHIVIDTGVGNDKRNRRMPAWNGRKGPFLDDLAAAGFSPDAVDTVVCTHLHVDHVGWNTRLVGGRWVPTFPNARYLLSKTELDHYRKMTDSSRSAIFEDSIKPIIDEGLVDFIEAGDAICAELSLFATPGHSPGHLSVQLKSRAEEAIFVADAIHHPCQIAHPDWSSTADIDPFQSARTRHALLRRVAGTPVVILGGHFAGGTVVRDGEAFRLVM